MKKIPTYVIGAFLTLASLTVFVPFSPWYPNLDGDSSWMFAMNQAVAQKLVFGRDIVFTFGPYASIYTALYHPATDHRMFWGSLFVGVCYSFLLILLARGIRPYWVLLYGLFLKGAVGSLLARDALLSSYPLLIALVVYRVTLPDAHPSKLKLTRPLTITLACLMTPLGLLPLIKGSLLLITGSIALLCFALLWHTDQKLLAYSSLFIPTVSALAFWVLAGQPIVALPVFLFNMSQIISGYTEAMAVSGNNVEIATWMIAAGLILYTVAKKTAPTVSRIVLFLSYAVFLFVSFKAGFVRHDHHAITAGTSIVLAALLINTLLKDRVAVAALLVALVVWADMYSRYVPWFSPQNFYRNVWSLYSSVTYFSAWEGIQRRWSGTDIPRKKFDESLSTIRKDGPIPRLEGATDIYSLHQAELLASGNSWSPRPIPQSYSAYTPDLAALDEKHLQHDGAPDNVLFRIEPIDGRLPALEDGLSWPALINNYYVMELRNDFAYLRRRASGRKDISLTEVSATVHRLGEDVYLPKTSGPFFAEINISPTVLGRVASLLFKPDQLRISVHLTDGSSRNYRIIATMAKSRFLLSPLIENTKDFIFLTEPENVHLSNKLVKSIQISPSGGRSIFWKPDYSMKLSTIDLVRDTQLLRTNLFDQILSQRPEASSETPPVQCDASIDSVNGVAPSPTLSAISNRLTVEGWTAIAGKDGIVPDEVFLTLSNSDRKLYVKTRPTPRPDVKEHFVHPAMPDPGFTADIDVSSLSGKYTLGVSRVYKGKLDSCQQFEIPLLITR